MNYSTDFKSIRNSVSAQEWQIRLDLAACYRLVDAYGMTDPDTDYGINVSGYVIHGAIHKARPNVACVLHTHTRAGMAVAAMKCGLLPLSQTSIRFVGHIATMTMKARRLTSTSASGSFAISGRMMR